MKLTFVEISSVEVRRVHVKYTQSTASQSIMVLSLSTNEVGAEQGNV